MTSAAQSELSSMLFFRIAAQGELSSALSAECSEYSLLGLLEPTPYRRCAPLPLSPSSQWPSATIARAAEPEVMPAD